MENSNISICIADARARFFECRRLLSCNGKTIYIPNRGNGSASTLLAKLFKLYGNCSLLRPLFSVCVWTPDTSTCFSALCTSWNCVDIRMFRTCSSERRTHSTTQLKWTESSKCLIPSWKRVKLLYRQFFQLYPNFWSLFAQLFLPHSQKILEKTY